MQKKTWMATFLVLLSIGLVTLMGIQYYVDPFFHYHKPVESLYYDINNQRSQNDGILKNFEYEGILSGTSMCENFKASEAEELFGVDFVKTAFCGSRFKEVNSALSAGLKSNPNVKYVFRSLDTYNICLDKDYLSDDLGSYPTYLYDNNPFNDIQYLLNKDIFCGRTIPMLINRKEGVPGGYTDFDVYSYWSSYYTFGRDAVLADSKPYSAPKVPVTLTKEEEQLVRDNIRQNVTDLAFAYPDVQFYCFFPPYSIVWWGEQYQEGNIRRQIEIENIAIEEILKAENIKLFDFDAMTEISTNLDNYKDNRHYGEWINSQMLNYMKNDVGLITKENYKDRLTEVYTIYSSYDYEPVFEK